MLLYKINPFCYFFHEDLEREDPCYFFHEDLEREDPYVECRVC